ncbi:MAG: tRNA (adenosine(37)-N6)-threonylcarbamoyltransferase complex dimerization subunit type 1 TsaB [Syntrophus sp. (in: bacteria)]|nr:tRNA (adenosine(37)-N6)-threonylcarbamoyltransferase complex dimerization subunit type 1 TsaB [Syntrophus sp. (in: bacteria)]
MNLRNFSRASNAFLTMKILAVDASQKTVSTALMANNVILAYIFVNSGRHHSEILLQAIEEVFRLAGLEPDEVDLFAVTIGPGSFTGLRIGAATIKGLALSTGKPVVGVSTLEALALNATPVGKRIICPMLDAQKNQVYTALYSPTEGTGMQKMREERIVDVDIWLEELEAGILFVGDGAVKYSPLIHRRFFSTALIAEGHQNHVNAAAAAVLAQDKFQQGQRLDLLTFTPCYLRSSEAERSIRQHTSDIDKPSEFR